MFCFSLSLTGKWFRLVGFLFLLTNPGLFPLLSLALVSTISTTSSSSVGFHSIILASDVRDKISFSIKTKQNKAMSVLSCFVMQVALCYVSEHAAHRICPGVSAFRVLERKSCRIRKWLLYCTNLRRGKAYVLRKSALQGFTRRV